MPFHTSVTTTLLPYEAIPKVMLGHLGMNSARHLNMFPLKPVRAIRGAGLTYPIDGLAMAAGAQIGTSNRTSAPTQSFAFDQRGALVFLNADRTEEALLAQGALFQPTI